MQKLKISIVGTVGVPARYGGFETLVDQLVQYSETFGDKNIEFTVYCDRKAYPDRSSFYHGAKLRYIAFRANGIQSILHDALSLFDAAYRKSDVILILGVSGAFAIPFIRMFSSCKIITNIDGIEWRREKWNFAARWFLRISEFVAIACSSQIIADNQGISDYIKYFYNTTAKIISYGGDHAISTPSTTNAKIAESFGSFVLTICRIEPENMVHMILEAFAGIAKPGSLSLVIMGNWHSSKYGIDLKRRFEFLSNVYLLDANYNSEFLFALRSHATAYIHGHSAGGTNPSLVEAMHFGLPILAYDCVFNRYTTLNSAHYFSSSADLRNSLERLGEIKNGEAMRTIANQNYRWSLIGQQYIKLLKGETD